MPLLLSLSVPRLVYMNELNVNTIFIAAYASRLCYPIRRQRGDRATPFRIVIIQGDSCLQGLFELDPIVYQFLDSTAIMPTRVLTPEYLNGIFKGLRVQPQRQYFI